MLNNDDGDVDDDECWSNVIYRQFDAFFLLAPGRQSESQEMVFSHTKGLHTQTPLRTEAFTHRSFYTEKSLHIRTFKQRSSYIKAFLNTEAFTHRGSYTEKSLHRGAFTHRRV